MNSRIARVSSVGLTAFDAIATVLKSRRAARIAFEDGDSTLIDYNTASAIKGMLDQATAPTRDKVYAFMQRNRANYLKIAFKAFDMDDVDNEDEA